MRLRLALVLVASALLGAGAEAAAPPPGERSLWFVFAVGPGGGGTDRFDAKSPTFRFAAGGSLPLHGRTYVDLGLGYSVANYDETTPVVTWTGDALLQTLELTAAFRVDHAGRRAIVGAAAGFGLAYASLGEPGGYGVYPEPVGSTVTPLATVGLTLEAPASSGQRFVFEVRYAWIDADLGGGAGGSLNAGGPSFGFGWRGVF